LKAINLIVVLILCFAIFAQGAERKRPRPITGSSAPTTTIQQQEPQADSIEIPASPSPITAAAATPVALRESEAPPSVQQAAPANEASAEAESFVRPGEAIQIRAYPDTGAFVNGFYPIDGEGRIYLPIIGKMKIVGMSEKAFLDTLKAQYISYLRYPNVQVRHSIRISLLGGFQRPGLYYIDPDYSMWDAVYLAGGTTREDGLKRMCWERDRFPVTKDIIPYYQSGQSLRSIGFQSGDQLWTPVEPKRKWWETVVKDIILSQVFPIVTTSASLFISYIVYSSYNKDK
jgi:protein involved in polysaccharide export with SLBB domain